MRDHAEIPEGPSQDLFTDLGYPLDSYEGKDYPLDADLFKQPWRRRFTVIGSKVIREGILANALKAATASLQDQQQEMIDRQLILNQNTASEKMLHRLAGRDENSDRALLSTLPPPQQNEAGPTDANEIAAATQQTILTTLRVAIDG